MKIIESASAFQAWRSSVPEHHLIGLVPTMGALHMGHASLIQASDRENDTTVVTIFVNPTQFNQASDFEKYPKTWETDLALCEKYGADVIFAPKSREEIYPDHYHYRVNENTLSNTLCGEFRPGHFEGVLTVVMKLLNLTLAHRAYFGEKDHQQLMLIEGMVKAFFLKTEIIPCPIIREHSGLAMSSRNLRLSANDLKIAPKLYEVMTTEKDIETAKKKLESLGFKVEYLVDQIHAEQKRRYAAAWLSEVRLIDNVRI